ncbi:Uncharacterized PIN and TRAM-domain containing protein Lin0266 [Geodia barretti]|uniref:Uncharacterized PIN and TRAM-domain containing protein Lin0266 n=1 Tax=Geodia barretti TaxID=519541 RepID=A0AA35SJE6_GEOBA|nr:Uncharacterized PIN and TRAM-domain containing protein Lin0266 [Geodia barretti]
MGALVFAALGWWLCLSFEVASPKSQFLPWGLVFVLCGAVVGGGIIPFLIAGPGRSVAKYISELPGATLVAAVVGLVVGLIVASLVSIPFYAMSGTMGVAVPVAISLLFGCGGMWLGIQRERDIRAIVPGLAVDNHEVAPLSDQDTFIPGLDPIAGAPAGRQQRDNTILVDTSAIIDGRIADLTVTGFLNGSLVVPRFVLDELRHIADSSDSLRRNRGRRGLEVLGRLRKDGSVPLQVLDVGVDAGVEVDARLVELARGMKGSILTTDYNLNRVAEIQGVKVLNVNELANAVKSIVLPGETLRVDIVQEGKEAGQGVAYLDDGTMVVVENGRRYINSSHDVQVTRVLQTAAGRIIFAQPRAG